jgi:hypothetical protein
MIVTRRDAVVGFALTYVLEGGHHRQDFGERR